MLKLWEECLHSFSFKFQSDLVKFIVLLQHVYLVKLIPILFCTVSVQGKLRGSVR